MSSEISDAKAWSHINELFGGDLRHPDELESVETISTGSPALDRALQVGGWARGRVYQMAGKPSSGKTFMALIAMARWQALDPENCCMFIDAEFTYDPVWAASLGVDNDRVMLIKTNDGVKIFTGLCGIPKKNKTTGKIKKIPGILDMIKDGRKITHVVDGKKIELNLAKLGVIVLDSVAAMQPPTEAESEVGKVNMAPLSRFLTVELKKLTPAVAYANTCFIAINHVKTKIGVMFGNPECVDPFSTNIKIRYKESEDNKVAATEEEISFFDFAKKFLNLEDMETPRVIDISHMGIEIESMMHDGSIGFSPMNAFIVKPSTDHHYVLGNLSGTGGHRVFCDNQWIKLMDHPNSVRVDEKIFVVDTSVGFTENYIANGHVNHNTTPGGAAWKHACSVMLMVAPISGAENKLVDDNDEKYGHKIRIKVEKNKLGKPFKKAEFFIDFTSGVDRINEQLLELGVLFGIIERPNNRTYIIDGEKLSSKADALDYITKNQDTIEASIRDYYLSGGESVLNDDSSYSDVNSLFADNNDYEE